MPYDSVAAAGASRAGPAAGRSAAACGGRRPTNGRRGVAAATAFAGGRACPRAPRRRARPPRPPAPPPPVVRAPSAMRRVAVAIADAWTARRRWRGAPPGSERSARGRSWRCSDAGSSPSRPTATPAAVGIREQRDQRVDRRIAAGAVAQRPPVSGRPSRAARRPARPSAAAVHSRAVDRAALPWATAPGRAAIAAPASLFSASSQRPRIRRCRPAPSARARRRRRRDRRRRASCCSCGSASAASSAAERLDRGDAHVRQRVGAGEHAAAARRCLHRAAIARRARREVAHPAVGSVRARAQRRGAGGVLDARQRPRRGGARRAACPARSAATRAGGHALVVEERQVLERRRGAPLRPGRGPASSSRRRSLGIAEIAGDPDRRLAHERIVLVEQLRDARRHLGMADRVERADRRLAHRGSDAPSSGNSGSNARRRRGWPARRPRRTSSRESSSSSGDQRRRRARVAERPSAATAATAGRVSSASSLLDSSVDDAAADARAPRPRRTARLGSPSRRVSARATPGRRSQPSTDERRAARRLPPTAARRSGGAHPPSVIASADSSRPARRCRT